MKLRYCFQINWLKTFYINFRALPFKDAVKLPLLIFQRTGICSLKGRITVSGPVKFGMIKIGRCEVSHKRYAHTVLHIDGTVHFSGKASLGSGSALIVSRGGELCMGKEFRITADTAIICEKSITIGEGFLSSWENLIMDSDRHNIFNKEGELLNPPRPITIGNHVWLGCRTTVLKGTVIPDNCIAAAGSVLTGTFHEPGAIIGSSGKNQQVLKSGIVWKE